MTLFASRSSSAVSGAQDRVHFARGLRGAGRGRRAAVGAEAAGDHAEEVAVHRRHMMYDRIAPLEPTSAPVTISRSFDSMKPVAAAAQPE